MGQYCPNEPISGNCDEYTTNDMQKGSLTFTEIRADVQAYAPVYITGTFEFEAKNKAGKIVKVTQGQFRTLADKSY